MTPLTVIFIEPAGGVTNVFENYMRLPLLGTLYLGTILDQRGHRVRVLNENILGSLVDPFELQADVYCLTALTVSSSRARSLAAQLKRIYPASKVIVGGIHASLLPGEFTDVADHVVVGEAEGLIVDLVEGRIADRIVQGSAVAELDALPLLNYRLLEGYRGLDVVPIMTSRGCPFDCSFCTVTRIFGRRFRMLSVARIMAEIENAMECFASRSFFFYDDNFAADRGRVEELCRRILEQRLAIDWSVQARTDLARHPELVRTMAEAGCRWVYIGFESIDNDTLEALHKSQTRDDIEQAIRVFHDCGISIHGMFMFGEDHDKADNVDSTVNFAIEQGIDTVQFMILTPFPGTRVYESFVAGNRLLHTNWDYYNGMFVVFRPLNRNPLRLQQDACCAYRRFYSLRRTVLDGLRLAVNVLCDALVWNFSRAHTYRLNSMFIRGGAKAIVIQGTRVIDGYMQFLRERTEEADTLNA
ncbi:MAG: radical SAM protein [Lentisphaeria bacterium]|nr:radical SAM protein [Lentisphaeria bacterium]